MTLTRYTRLPSMFRDFDEFFRDFTAPVVEDDRVAGLVPAADVVENEKNVELRLDMPGVDPEQIEVKLDGNLLTISAERKNERTEQSKGWIRQERAWGTFARSFTLPNTLDGSKPEAVYRHGVLTVTLPKKEEVLPKTLKVKVEA
ncbi:MAG: Hsp20/alpha crystallin family protein [Myxococcota bacterium]|jgi:HSP20 family protein